MTQIECVVKSCDQVGELPLWDNRSNVVWWIDVRRPRLQCFDPLTAEHRIYPTGGKALGSYAMSDSNGMILAQDDGIYEFIPPTGKRKKILHPEADRPDNRWNDGRCDRRGRFWVGSMNDKTRQDDGSFWRIDKDYSATKFGSGFNIPNGVCFSPDDRVMYIADTPKRMIWAFDFNIDAGIISNRRVFVDLSANIGRPDGSTVDAGGYVWNCEYGGKRVVRYTPDGRVDRIIDMPVTNITCACFAGEKLDRLYVTTAAQGLSDDQMKKEPNAGCLFQIDVNVTGLPESRFNALP